jgi:putative hydrolase of HD superfamily
MGIHVSAADPRQAEFGITLALASQGQGLASEALRALFDYLFSELNLHRVTGSVDPRNTASMALLARVGMRQEGLHLESFWSKGEWTDDAVFALLAREWREGRREGMPMDAIASFLTEAEKLKCVTRTAYVSDQTRHENSAEHSWHLALALFALARERDLGIDLHRAVTMALAHDLCEIDAGDVSVYDPGRAGKTDAERACVARLAALGPAFGREVQDLWREYEVQETRESRWVRVLDRFLPFLVNLATEGRAWRDRGISRSQVLAINEVVRVQAPELFAWMLPRIEACVAKGWLRDA